MICVFSCTAQNNGSIHVYSIAFGNGNKKQLTCLNAQVVLQLVLVEHLFSLLCLTTYRRVGFDSDQFKTGFSCMAQRAAC